VDLKASCESRTDCGLALRMQSKEFIDAGCTIRFENLHDAKPITVDELEGVVLKPLTYLTTNEERLNLLDVVKEPYLFSSDDLEKILYVTESTKTRLEMIHLVGPRLLDPHVKTEKLIGMFRFAEEKEMVEEVLKARTHTLASKSFSPLVGGSLLDRGSSLCGRGRGSRSGRGYGGRIPVPTFSDRSPRSSLTEGEGRGEELPSNLQVDFAPMPSVSTITSRDSETDSESSTPQGSVRAVGSSNNLEGAEALMVITAREPVKSRHVSRRMVTPMVTTTAPSPPPAGGDGGSHVSAMSRKFSGLDTGPLVRPIATACTSPSPKRIAFSKSESDPGLESKETPKSWKLTRATSDRCISPPPASGAAGNSENASKCAAVLGITKEDFLALTPQVQTGEGGYTYLEVVRRNYTKQYEGWDHHQLEEYIGEAEFAIALGRTKVRFDSSVRGLSVR